ncbi:MAG: exodeoxyribonuclease VII large subunit [Synechococcales cyanobacterium T60_A2020_003]|nr:exodeoxyribonuclease VII large subunit [Synechococcales cyanobacterium T60_A2020_003]
MFSNQPRLTVPEMALSVAGLTRYIQSLVEEDVQLRQVWVTGEVSSVNHHPKGLFFTLQDPDDKAAIACVVWRSQASRLATLPKIGEQVIVLGQVRLYAPRGEYRLVGWQVLPAGEGLLALREKQVRDRLRAEGLFASERKRPLPVHPQTVAVVTSPQAAAWGDIQRTLRHRYPGLRVLLSPAQVQGELAPVSIVRAIQRVERDGRAEVLILARGGGASEDLACFNDERVVRAVADCSIPVIAGIGHQRDETLADLVADAYAHTPTAAAEKAVPDLRLLQDDHRQRTEILVQALRERVYIAQDEQQRLRSRLHRVRLDQSLQHEQESLDWMRDRLITLVRHRLQSSNQHCQRLRDTLTTLDPESVLKRGYAVVRDQKGGVVRSPVGLYAGQHLMVQFTEGSAEVEVVRPVEYPLS